MQEDPGSIKESTVVSRQEPRETPIAPEGSVCAEPESLIQA